MIAKRSKYLMDEEHRIIAKSFVKPEVKKLLKYKARMDGISLSKYINDILEKEAKRIKKNGGISNV